MRGSSLRICVPNTFRHPRVMSRSLPHLTLTTSTSALSPTSPMLQSSSPTHPSLLSHDRRSCGSSDLQSPTGCEPKRIELDRILGVEHQDQILDIIFGDDYQSPITEEMDEFGQIGVESFQSLIHSAYDSAERIADSDLEDEQLRKMLASPLKIEEREGDFDSSRKQRVSGKPDAMFSFDSEPTLHTFLARNRGNEPGNQFESSVHSVFKTC